MSTQTRPDDAPAPRGRRRRPSRAKGSADRSRERRHAPDPARLARLAEARAAVDVGTITYPEQLPVSAHRDEISAAIRDHQVVIVAGETGSGKTTQIPKILLELGRGRTGQIAHTQPRRIAARSVAERVAEELGSPLGEVVGYQVRFTDSSSDGTLVKVMTDGILLAAIQRDPQLLAYDTIVVDEAHERSLNIDFLLGYLARLLPQRPDLKLVITSATIDSDRFARHFASPAPGAVPDAAGSTPAGTAPEPVPAPVVEVSGRTYPVEIRYRPLVGEDGQEDRDLVTGVLDAVDELVAVDRTRRETGPGDILVFLSGEREIRDVADALRGHLGARAHDPRDPGYTEVLPLYARLSAAEQHRVFAAHPGRRIVLATNVAETSLTVPGVRYVIDPGTARISRYSKATKVQRLPIEPVSQASARQRSGRSGRLSDGVAIRLYSQEDFEARPPFTEPEILRTSLASVILQMIAVGVVASPDDVARFPFVEPPDTRAVRDGVQLLTELGALEVTDGRTRLTAVGHALAAVPTDPRLARMMVEGARRGVLEEVTVLAAALSIQDPRERPLDDRDRADQLHARFNDPTSDFLTYLNLWAYVRELQRELSGNQFRRRLKAEHLNYLRVREWQDLTHQLRDSFRSAAPTPPLSGRSVHATRRDTPDGSSTQRGGGAATTPAPNPNPAPNPDGEQPYRRAWDGDTIHRALLPGLLSQVGMQQTAEVKASARAGKDAAQLKRLARQARNEYLGARGIRFAIFPGSTLAKKPPELVMAAELVETSRLWARDVARIRPEWAEEAGAHVVRRTYSEPAWSSRQGAAVAREKVLLYGVPLVADRQVLFAKVDPEGARELFVRHALVEGDWHTRHAFWRHNQEVLEEAQELEARSRRRGMVVGDDVLFAFYDARVPAEVVSAAHFDQWWKTARREDPHLLDLTLDLLVPEADAVDPDQFPEAWPQGDLTLPLTYQLSPGSDADGVTVHVPISVLARLSPRGFDWMVPGLLDELCVATIRSLPKAVRVQLVPAPDVGASVAAWLRENTPAWADMARAGDMAEPFRSAFTRAVRALRGVEVPDDAWSGQAQRLPAHLRMTFRVVSEPERGVAQVLGEGDDLPALQRRLAGRAEAAVRTAVRAALEAARAEAGAGSLPVPPTPTGTPGAGSGDVAGDTPHVSQQLPAQRDEGGAGAVATALEEQAGLTTWPTGLPDGALPDLVETSVSAGAAGRTTVRGYPALVVERGRAADGRDDTVALRVLADRTRRDGEHAAGVRALLLREAGLATPRVTSRWTGTQALTLASSPYRSTEALVRDVQVAAIRDLTDGGADPRGGTLPVAAEIRDAGAYAAARDLVRERLEDEVHRVIGDVVAALTAARTLDAEVRASSSLALLNTLTDVRDQAAALVGPGFVSATPGPRLRHLARYLRAASYRLEKAAANPQRDAELAWRVHDVEQAYERVRAEERDADPARSAELADVRWLVEELRVSLFAQQLGTDGPVSEKRIRKILHPTGGW